MTLIRPLDPRADRPAVLALQRRAADYIDLESGLTPGDATVDEFFTDAPPGSTAADCLKLGLFDGPRLDAIADLGFGFPTADDAYLGLLLVAEDRRNQGLGRRFLAHLVAAAKARGAPRLYLAVLEANAHGRAFWQREGFTEALRGRPTQIGSRSHVRIRMVRDL